MESSSPRFKTLRSFETKTEPASPVITKNIPIENSFQPLPENPPLSQYKIWLTELPEIKSKNPLTEEIKALIAIPVRMILLVEIKFEYLLPRPLAK